MRSQQTDQWRIYDAFSQAVATVFFTEEAAGLPVYLDLDVGAIAELGEQLGIPSDVVIDDLARAVEGILDLRGRSGDVFAIPLHQTRQWLRIWQRTKREERSDLPAPPVLGLLAVFSMAAERMGSDVSMASSNYFGPLSQLLGVTDTTTRDRLARDYRHCVEYFWNVVSLWLVGLDGMRGLPSAVALSHRYIGLSISQALVREYDRGKLPKFFAAYGLDAGQEVTPREIEAYLDEWMRRDPPVISRGLAKLWRGQSAARERIASVVALELQSWDGHDGDATHRSQATTARAGEVRLVALTRTSMFGNKVELSIVARLGREGPRRMEITSTVDEKKPTVEFMPGANGWHRLHRPADLAQASILDGVLQLVDDSGALFQRRPRLVVPMRKDEALGQFLEVERLQLAEDSLVFVVSRMAAEVQVVLTQIARAGFRRVEGTEGVPEGWTLFTDVQVLGLLSGETQTGANDTLNVLQPTISSQLAFAEGLKLPGRLRKYSVDAPPELRAVTVAAEHQRLEVTRKNTENLDASGDVALVELTEVACRRDADGGALMFPLADANLPEGDYEALLYVNREKDPTARLPFYLRSGDTVDLAMWSRSSQLAHQPTLFGGRAVLSADEYADPSAAVVYGAVVTGASAATPTHQAPREVWWDEQPPAHVAHPPAATLTIPDPSSCMVTSAHYWDLPYASTKAVEGTCRKCGQVKRFPNTPWAAKAKKAAREKIESQYNVDVQRVASVQPRELTWDIGLDALMHAGGGPQSALERVALQIEGSHLFVARFTQTLESLGHLQVYRDPHTLDPGQWEIAPSALAQLVDGSHLLVGYWPAGLVATLAEQLESTSGRLQIEAQADAPSRKVVRGLTARQIADIADSIGVSTTPNAAHAVLSVVPGLGAVEKALPRLTMPGARSIRRFHLASASWVGEAYADKPGAYRLESFGRTYVFRRHDDVADGVARIGTAQLVKHLEAHHAGRPLLAYRPEHRHLDVPLGADLPGLYGRAAVLCSGRPPRQHGPLLRYTDVPAEIANMLTARLNS